MRIYRVLALAIFGLLMFVGETVRTPAALGVDAIVIKPANGITPISLRDRLIAGLQARLKSEIAFCEKVALEVELGHLPLRMVDETFLWARQRAAPPRNGLQYRPIIYFQPGIRARAARIKVAL
jgi:hypothetical protein